MAKTARSSGSTAATTGDVARFLDSVAPPQLAQEWDNVGFLAGDPSTPCRSVILCIDMSAAVVAEAAAANVDLVLAYHPPIFRPMRRVIAAGAGGSPVWDAARAGLAIYSPHTALDAAVGGTNDVLADLAGVAVDGPFEWVAAAKPEYKFVVFVPPAEIDHVAAAMFDAGAGRIGDYTHCSYRVDGRGTFFGTDSTNPAVGEKGRHEFVEEVRLESVVPADCVAAVTDAVRAAHSYEEPAFDVYPLEAPRTRGIGRVGRFKKQTTLGALAKSLKRKLQLQMVELVGDVDRGLDRAAICVGSAGRLPLDRPLAADCDVVITGELRHHDALAFQAAGKAAVMLGHWASERPTLPVLAQRIADAFPNMRTIVSDADRAPTAFV